MKLCCAVLSALMVPTHETEDQDIESTSAALWASALESLAPDSKLHHALTGAIVRPTPGSTFGSPALTKFDSALPYQQYKSLDHHELHPYSSKTRFA